MMYSSRSTGLIGLCRIWVICSLLLSFPTILWAQTEVVGCVVDAEDQGPIPGAMIQALDSAQAIITFAVT